MSRISEHASGASKTAPRSGTAAAWRELSVAMSGCVLCPDLASNRTHVVPGVASAGADVLLIGEAPGAQEDATALPFVGKSGQLLDKLLAEAGLPREQVAIANVVKCRPPGNRKPRRAEVEHCRPWLKRQISVLDPLVLITLGGTAAEWAFGSGARISALREEPVTFDGRRTVVTYHPSAAIRFGPKGRPLAALREDLARAADLAGQLRAERLGG
jgi:DNA polymerase